jgi:hypothetical protein
MSGSSTSLGGSGGRRCAGTPALIPRFLQVSRHGRTARIRDVVGKAAEAFWEQLEEQDAERRLADRLASFREVNDGIGETAEQEAAVFVCECGSQECLTTLELSVTEYKRIRSNRTWAVVTPGHELPGLNGSSASAPASSSSNDSSPNPMKRANAHPVNASRSRGKPSGRATVGRVIYRGSATFIQGDRSIAISRCTIVLDKGTKDSELWFERRGGLLLSPPRPFSTSTTFCGAR